MNEMYFSVPYGTREMSIGITDSEGGELWNFYLIFIESVTANLRRVIVYGDYAEDGDSTEKQSSCSERHKDADDKFEFEFDISETEKVRIEVCMSDEQYHIYVKH